MDPQGNKIYAVDFDGTLSIDARWPEIGTWNKALGNMLIAEKEKGARIILWTCRSGEALEKAVCFCKENGLEFDTVNANLPESVKGYGGDTRKVNADYYIDDKNLKIEDVTGKSIDEEYRKRIKMLLEGKSNGKENTDD